MYFYSSNKNTHLKHSLKVLDYIEYGHNGVNND